MKTKKQWAIYRCKLSCQVGKDACEGKDIPVKINPEDWKMYQLFCAISELAEAINQDNLK